MEFNDKMYGCYKPFKRRIKLEHLNRYVTVYCPCGKCINCLRSYKRAWTMRMREEMAGSKSSYFITLTYNEFNVPHGCNVLLLCKSDYQLFLKRLRKRLSNLDKIKLRYVVCGEYGGKTNRPHYHLALFLDNNVPYRVVKKFIDDSWNKGFNSVEYLDVKKIEYLVKYFNKLDTRIHDVKTFRNMSNGIGRNFLSPRVIAYYKNNLTTICHRYGYTYAMPRYFKDKIFNDEEKEILLLDSYNNWLYWLSDFHDLHGDSLPWYHYQEVNEEKLNRARIFASTFLDDDHIVSE